MWSPTDSPWSPITSPLNQAHQLGRQADVYVKSGKFEEALHCHKRAAGENVKELVCEGVAIVRPHLGDCRGRFAKQYHCSGA
ncbi:Hypothetical predicted protein [Octopus vulgaris]|uniref:Nuclear receptor-binding factor 2 MIT domain-containing protein n=1 Tax=Octopus vulgaris TaxID=6645 RepID=A0AA36AL24_OCTVU|nr:Hypothetical predicted protein [Octopus vulgaris]